MAELGLLNEQSAVRRLRLGDVRLTYVVDGAMAMVAGAFFPTTPTQYWRDHPEALDAHGRVAASAGGLLVERGDRKLLIDAGLGPFRGPLSVGKEPFGAADSGSLPDILAELGVDPGEIDTVAYTHLHLDHVGWAFVDGRKFFPNARYLVAAQEWAPHDHGVTVPGVIAETTVVPMRGNHELIGEGEEVWPGVHAIVTPGHTPGHSSFIVSAEAGRIVVFGDSFHTPAQITHPEWGSTPDTDSEGVLKARARVLGELERPGTLGFGAHFGDQAFGRVVRDGDGAAVWEPVATEFLRAAPRDL
ncbi:MBL fold metallo-hydrolase [Kutzneria kofuensis]|jgi:glyoxylase-like metal-dependent hydrolase (beta-lactamase superfamily II)|uniref:Glyoxylase-like metal-dependent hydrolase (Beta-lactamase superfamily II) n=1 Tax=Kutzneria kofuensis TaxID=103725 RepID=A0A7W9NM03_9PSEU|nr:MBL fold metallo-hydrolase [Kutzneria kofuensis]MBB5897620.1 glyoxylase-like metal-dependent hydrolase (beta-lactamase superfamily II) [Kutzneria kofuensis]